MANTEMNFGTSINNFNTNIARSSSALDSTIKWQQNNMYRTSYYEQSMYNVSKKHYNIIFKINSH